MNKRLILIGGIPGSGKTHIGKQVAQRTGLFIDKDTVSRRFTESMLTLLGSYVDDRETEIYLTNIRDIEYETMMKQALENLELGHSVVCSAPFIREFTSTDWLVNIQLEAGLLNASVIKLWIHVDPITAHERIIARGTSRDTWKLANWNTYIQTVPLTPPRVTDMIVIDNSRTTDIPLSEQIESIMDHLSEKVG